MGERLKKMNAKIIQNPLRKVNSNEFKILKTKETVNYSALFYTV